LPTEKARIGRRPAPANDTAAAGLVSSFGEGDARVLESDKPPRAESENGATMGIERTARFGDKIGRFAHRNDRPDT